MRLELQAIGTRDWRPAWLDAISCTLGEGIPARNGYRPYATASDEELIFWSARDDKRAFDLLISRHGALALRLASRLVANASVAEDLVQDAMIRAWSQANRFDPRRGSFKTWLSRIVVNLCIDHLRQRRPEPIPDAFDAPDPSASAEQSMQNADTARALMDAMHALPPQQRAALILVYLEDMSGLQAAQALGVSVKAIERLLCRGRGSLRARLDAAHLGSVS